jgi:hypothetical protein
LFTQGSVYRIVKSVWFRQVFGLLRVQFRQVYSGFSLDRFTRGSVWTGLLRVQFRQVYSGFSLDRFPWGLVSTGLLRVQFRQVSLYIFHLIFKKKVVIKCEINKC